METDSSGKQNYPKGKKSKTDKAEEPMTTKMKKRKHVETEGAAVQIPRVTNPDEETNKKHKKRKKTKATKEADSELTELPHPADCPVGTQEPEGEGDQEKALTPEEKRVLERKMKKILKKEEKKRLKAEGQTKPKTPEPRQSAWKHSLEYLECWLKNRLAWKFQKSRQTWLLQNMFNSEKIPDNAFAVLLQYLEGLCGTAKEITVQKALKLVEESGNAPNDAVVQQRAQRAREVIQLLS